MTPTEQNILFALFSLSRDNSHISARTLGLAAQVRPTVAAQALVTLERAGLVDATRARLTMRGLMTAAQRGPAAGGPRLNLAAAMEPRQTAPERLPVAARPSQAPAPELSLTEATAQLC